MEIFSIHTVERETGLTKDALRKWEVRYGFPQPQRQSNGERFYTRSDLNRLISIKKLMEQGYKPSQVVALSLAELERLKNGLPSVETLTQGPYQSILNQAWQALQVPDSLGLSVILKHALSLYGCRLFVVEIMPVLNNMVGTGWANGSIAIHQEHLYAVHVRDVLICAIDKIPLKPDGPRVLLSTPPEEYHQLGLLMLQAILALSGAHCILLGASVPVTELIKAAKCHQVSIVALSFSIAYPSRRIKPYLDDVRLQLPENIQLWAGGAVIDNLRRKLDSIWTFDSLAAVEEEISRHSR